MATTVGVNTVACATHDRPDGFADTRRVSPFGDRLMPGLFFRARFAVVAIHRHLRWPIPAGRRRSSSDNLGVVAWDATVYPRWSAADRVPRG